MGKMICYCFKYTETDIKADLRQNDGRSLILEKIVAQKRAGACQCATKHPEGR